MTNIYYSAPIVHIINQFIGIKALITHKEKCIIRALSNPLTLELLLALKQSKKRKLETKFYITRKGNFLDIYFKNFKFLNFLFS